MRAIVERLALATACAALSGCLGGHVDTCDGVSTDVPPSAVQNGRYTITDTDAAGVTLVVDVDAGVVTRTRVADGGTVVQRYRITGTRRSY